MYKLVSAFIASVWLVNGLICKLLNLVPRHQEIVAEILGSPHARTLTMMIGISECVMAFWVFTHYKSRAIAILQMLVVLVMNVLEVLLVPDLLLWGRWNFIFALCFVGIVYYNEFILKEQKSRGASL